MPSTAPLERVPSAAKQIQDQRLMVSKHLGHLLHGVVVGSAWSGCPTYGGTSQPPGHW